MSRQRMTWKQGEDKSAAQPPANPREDGWHPAHEADPGPHDYENGDTSKWKEDVTPPPYTEGEAPSVPKDDGWHPADKAAAQKEAAEQIRVAAEKKASKCIRIADYLLPNQPFNVVEDQALDFMDLPDAAIDSTLNRLAEIHTADDEEEEEETDDEAGKKATEVEAATEVSATDQRIADLTSLVSQLTTQVRSLVNGRQAEEEETDDEAGKKAEIDPDEALLQQMLAEEASRPDPDEALLQSMLAEQAESAKAAEQVQLSEDEQLLQSMMAEEAGNTAAEETNTEASTEVEAGGCGESMEESVGEYEGDLGLLDLDVLPEPEYEMDMGMAEDPMGLMADETPLPQGDDMLTQLFAQEARAAMGLEGEADQVAAITKAASTAQKPQPRKASRGPKTVGTQTRTASDKTDLESLWETAPDVSGVFT